MILILQIRKLEKRIMQMYKVTDTRKIFQNFDYVLNPKVTNRAVRFWALTNGREEGSLKDTRRLWG